MNTAEYLAVHAGPLREWNRPSPQIRAGHPHPEPAPHPRAEELAETMRDIYALGHGCGFRDLIGAGFTAAEIAEHAAEAERIATLRGTRHLAPSPDLLADIARKAAAPMPNDPPLPAGSPRETQALFVAWGHYCQSRMALALDPWPGQRERCMDQLLAYLERLPLLPRDRKHVLRKAGEALQPKAQ